MQLRSLEYLIELEKAGSINKAAGNLFISQQGLRSVLGVMEAELGVKLVRRSRHGIEFTEAGAAVLEHAHRIVDEYALLRQSAVRFAPRAQEKEAVPTIHLAVSTYVSLRLLGTLIPFKEGISVSVHEWSNERIKDALAHGALVRGEQGHLFLFDWVSSDSLMGALGASTVVATLQESRLGLVCQADSRVGKMVSLSPEDVQNVPLACFSGKDYLRTIDEAFGKNTLPDASLKVSDSRAISLFLSSNSEAGVVADELSLKGRSLASDQPDLAFVPFRGVAALVTGFAYAASDPQTPAYERLIAECREKLVEQGE